MRRDATVSPVVGRREIAGQSSDRWPRLHRLHPESGELLHLDLLRFLASAGVVLCHSLEFFYRPEFRDLAHRRSGGFGLFVDSFFVVSGYVIAYVYSNRMETRRQYGVFLQRRVGRLLPLNIVTMLAGIVVVLMVRRLGMVMTHPVSLQPACLATTAFLLVGLVPCGGQPLNGVAWSISAEMVMYVAFPLFLLLMKGRPARAIVVAGGAILAVTALRNVGTWDLHFDVLRALPAFLFGMALFVCRSRVARLPAPLLGMVGAVALLAIGSFAIWPLAVLLPLAYAAPAFAVAADCRGRAPALVRRFAPLGQLTYSIYMIHGLVLLVILNGIGDKMLRLSPPFMAPLALVTYGVILLLSWISLQLVETPLRRKIDALPLFGRPGERHQRDHRPAGPSTSIAPPKVHADV